MAPRGSRLGPARSSATIVRASISDPFQYGSVFKTDWRVRMHPGRERSCRRGGAALHAPNGSARGDR
jgi:hypothetical protein